MIHQFYTDLVVVSEAVLKLQWGFLTAHWIGVIILLLVILALAGFITKITG